MIPERLFKIIELLKNKTLNRKAVWNKTSGTNQFKLSINDGSAITISQYENNYNNNSDYEYSVVIFNGNGDAIERFSTEMGEVTKSDVTILQSFHKAASDSYYKVEETMEALFESIESQDIVGIKEDLTTGQNNNNADDDDLPF